VDCRRVAGHFFCDAAIVVKSVLRALERHSDNPGGDEMNDLLLGLAVGASLSISIAVWVIADKLAQISDRLDAVTDTLRDLLRKRQENDK
jgi:hypothetical protein